MNNTATTLRTESHEVTIAGTVIGYAARRCDQPFSLCTANGMDLLSTPTTLAEAVEILTAHHNERVTR